MNRINNFKKCYNNLIPTTKQAMIIKDSYSLVEGGSDPLSPVLASFPVSPPLPQSLHVFVASSTSLSLSLSVMTGFVYSTYSYIKMWSLLCLVT